MSAYSVQWEALAAIRSHRGIVGGSSGVLLSSRHTSRMTASASMVMPIDLCWLTSANSWRMESVSSMRQAQTNCSTTPATTSQCSNWAIRPQAVAVLRSGIRMTGTLPQGGSARYIGRDSADARRRLRAGSFRPAARIATLARLSPCQYRGNMSDSDTYTPPRVWTWDKESGGRFAKINRPVAGPTHEQELPVGEHPLQLYSLATPNGVKVTVMLEELLAAGHSGAEYDAWLVNIREGDQFGSGFVSVNPNSKIPALMDRSGAKPTRVFESGAILLYLAEKFGAFLPADPAEKAETLSWLFWQMGSAPYLGGRSEERRVGKECVSTC